MTIMLAVIGNAMCALASDSVMPAGAVSSWQKSIAMLDWLRSDLVSADAEAVASWATAGSTITVGRAIHLCTTGVALTAPAGWTAEPAVITGRSWLLEDDPWFRGTCLVLPGRVTFPGRAGRTLSPPVSC